MTWQEFYKAIRDYYHIEDEDTVIKIPFENIIEVNADTLIFKNNDGVIEKIILNDCFKNFCSDWGGEPRNRSGEIINVVGGRFFSKPVAFYEFFTDGHHTRFCMVIKQTPFKKFLSRIGLCVDSKAFSEFYSLQKKLNSFGYSAIDLT